jgi:hypothetical protein
MPSRTQAPKLDSDVDMDVSDDERAAPRAATGSKSRGARRARVVASEPVSEGGDNEESEVDVEEGEDELEDEQAAVRVYT